MTLVGLGFSPLHACPSARACTKRLFLLLGLVLCVAITAHALPQTGYSFVGAYGQSADSKTPEALFSLDSVFSLRPGPETSLSASGRIERPLNRFENFSIPKISFTATHQLHRSGEVGLSTSLVTSLLAPTNWGSTGASAKISLWFLTDFLRSGPLRITTGIAPFARLNAYRTTAAGDVLPTGGFTQKLAVSYDYRRLSLELALLLEQSARGNWRNDYGTQQSVAYRMTPNLQGGLSHELESSIIDSSTGRATPLALFSTRKSFFSVFVKWEEP